MSQEIVRIGKLDTFSHLRSELSRLYRAARKAVGPNISASDAAKLGYMLQTIGRQLEASEIEARIKRLEDGRSSPLTATASSGT